MGRNNRLARHFTDTAAAIAAAALACAAGADVVYSGIVNITVPANIDGTYMNVETGAYSSTASAVPGWDVNPYGTSLTAVSLYAATGTGYMRAPEAGTLTARTNLLADTPIGVASFFYASSSATIGTLPGQWPANAEGLFGFKFLASDGLTHYGWVRLSIGADAATRVIVDYAWENIAGTDIRAGAGGGPPPAYDPCAAFNPVANAGSNSLPLNQTTATDLTVSGACEFVAYKANYFKFSPTVSGDYVIDTCASGAGTRLAVLDGCAAGSAVIGCNDDSCGTSSSMTLAATAGSVYYIVIGAEAADAVLPSPISVAVTPPPAPECAAATALAFGSNPFDLTGSTFNQNLLAGATASTIYKARFFTFTPTVTGAYTFSACGSVNDTKLAIGNNCPGSGLTFSAFAYNDDNCACSSGCGTTTQFNYSSGLHPTNTGVPLTQDLVAGTTYKVLLGGYAATTLEVMGDLVIDGPPQTQPCPGDFNSDGVRDGLDLTVILANWGTPGGDLDGDGVTDGLDLTVILAGWGACP